MSSDDGSSSYGGEMDDDGSYIIEEEEVIEEEIIEEDDHVHINNHNSTMHNNTEENRSLMNDILQEKLERIAILERKTKMQDLEIQKLSRQSNEETLKHKQEVYFLKLELDGAKRDWSAAEERMAELFEDLKHVAAMQEKAQKEKENGEDAPASSEESYNYAAEVLENQVSMVQTSSGEVIKTLKDEIADLMEDRCRMELDLLNQLATLDREKRNQEYDFEQRLQYKEETIDYLKEQQQQQKQQQQQQQNQNGSFSDRKSSTYNGEMDELEEELLKLSEEKRRAEDLLVLEKQIAEDTIQQLEETNSKLQQKLEALADDVSILREGPDTQDTVKALDRISAEREEIVSTLERVATIWERADGSIVSLEDAMDKLRPTEGVAPIKGDREKLLTTLETASLIHGQVKVALLLVEVRLRNQLQSIKNDKLSMTWAAPDDKEVTDSMRQILNEGLAAVAHVESTITQQVRVLEEKALDEANKMKAMITDRSKTLEGMQDEHKTLEHDINALKSSNQDSSGNILANISKADLTTPEKHQQQQPALTPNTVATADAKISNEIIEQLHMEVHRIVERIRQKNETIETLQNQLEDHKTREESLKKDLKRALRRPSKVVAAEGGQQQQQQKPLGVGSSSQSLSSPLGRTKVHKPKGSSRSLTGDEISGVDGTEKRRLKKLSKSSSSRSLTGPDEIGGDGTEKRRLKKLTRSGSSKSLGDPAESSGDGTLKRRLKSERKVGSSSRSLTGPPEPSFGLEKRRLSTPPTFIAQEPPSFGPEKRRLSTPPTLSGSSPMSPKGSFNHDSSAAAADRNNINKAMSSSMSSFTGIAAPPVRVKSPKKPDTGGGGGGGFALSPTPQGATAAIRSPGLTSKPKMPKKSPKKPPTPPEKVVREAPFTSPGAKQASVKKVSPLMPSPREISKPRMYSPV